MRTVSILLLLVACGDDLLGDAEPTDPSGRTLTGSQVVRYRALDRATLGEQPIDLYDTVVEAHVPDRDGWSVRPGTGHRDGSFEIAGVPDGHVWLRLARRPFGEVFYWTDADHVAFDEQVLGPEVPASAADGDRLHLAVDGLAPWQAGDELAWFVPNDVVFDTNLVAPAPNTTDLAGTSIDWTGRALADVAPDEPALVVQYRTQSILGAAGADTVVDVRAPVRSAAATMHQVAGVDGTLDVTLAPPAPLPYRLAWARDAFEAERAAVHPTRAGASINHNFSVIAIPGAVDGDLWISTEYPLASLADPAVLEGTTPLDLGLLAIPNPFPAEWLVDLFVVTFPIDFPLPDGRPQTLEAVVGARSSAIARTGPVTPGVTAMRAPRIANRDAFTALAGVGTTPELAWSAPAVGTPTSYQLRVIQAITEPPPPFRPGWYLAAELLVPGDVTSVRMPAGILEAGTTYGVMVRTFAQPGQDVRTRPFVSRVDAAFADTILGPFTP